MGIRAAGAGVLAVGAVALAAALGPAGDAPPGGPAGDAPRDGQHVDVGPHGAAGWAAERSPLVEYAWPLRPEPRVERSFEAPDRPWGAGHRGADLAAAAPSQPVHAAAGGVVVFAGRVVDRTVVSIDHPDGIRTTYEPVEPAVRVGDTVTRGTVIGHLSGWEAEPHCARDCLHWGARVGDRTYLDPLTLVGAEPVTIRLYPY